MKLQLDTTVLISRLLKPPNDPINVSLKSLADKARSIEASTYAKKEFGFSLISDCCTMLARVTRTKSLSDTLNFIDRYGYYKKRFRGRMLCICWKFFVHKTMRDNWERYDVNKRDTLLAEEFARFLRLCIPVFWEEFEKGLKLPLQNRTKCPFAHTGPVDNGTTFEFATRRKCNASLKCALPNMIAGERKRALKLLARLRGLDANENTQELRKIRALLESFLERDDENTCYEMCNQGIGDLIIALETPPDRTLVTTNAKETKIISPAISQEHVLLPPDLAS